MKSGTCAKCGSDEVRRVPQTAVEVSIAITWSKTASVDYFVCASCGFIELYVQDEKLLPKLAEKYPKVC